MKSITNSMKTLALLLFLAWASGSNGQCTASFNYTVGTNGNVTFNSTSAPVTSVTSYFWVFGNNTSTVVNNPTLTTVSTTYSANGVYTVSLMYGTGTCSTGVTQTINVNTVNTSTCLINAGFSYSQGSNGFVSFMNTTSPTVGVGYTWNLGNSVFSNLTNPTITYTANGTYTVNLTAYTSSFCVSQASAVVTVTNISACTQTASFSYSIGSSGYVSFLNSTTPTLGINYYWNFGNASTSTLMNPSVTFTANGTYSILLAAYTTSACVSTASAVITITNVNTCPINASFNYSVGNNGFVSFYNTTTPTLGVSYTWNLGNSVFSNLMNPTRTYTANGTYIVYLTAYTSSFCVSQASAAVSISNVSTCSLNAGFTYTPGSSGQVFFTNTTSGMSPGITFPYLWNFGDGWTSSTPNPSHTYANAGIYNVSLIAHDSTTNCIDTINQSITISGIPCIANSNFTMAPTSIPKFWIASPSYPWNVTNSVWNWGDNSSSNGLYSSHQYSVSGNYNICLTVTVSCGSTSSTCAIYSISKSTADIIHINVVQPSNAQEIVGISEEVTDLSDYSVFPNPNNGTFSLQSNKGNRGKVTIKIYSVMGEKLFEGSNKPNKENLQIQLDKALSGIYFIELISGSTSVTKKVIVSK